MENESDEKDVKEIPVDVIEVTRKRRFYKANENPPILLALLFALQVSDYPKYILMFIFFSFTFVQIYFLSLSNLHLFAV